MTNVSFFCSAQEEAMVDEQSPLFVGYLNKGRPFELVREIFVRMREKRRQENSSLGGVERRKLVTHEVHLNGLYEHEIAIDVPLPLPDGHSGRVLLKSPLFVGYLNKGRPFELVREIFVRMREKRRQENSSLGGVERRKLVTHEVHLNGLYEHEIAIDVPLPLPDGHSGRVLLN